jgi:hypothetical protein
MGVRERMMIFFYSSKNKRKVFFEFFFLINSSNAQKCSNFFSKALLSHRKETNKKTRERQQHLIKIHLFAAVCAIHFSIFSSQSSENNLFTRRITRAKRDIHYYARITHTLRVLTA